MKKLKFILLAMVAMLPFLQSCNSSEVDQATHFVLATIRVTTGTSYHFELDNGETIYPGDVSRIAGYDGKSKNDCRAIVYYKPIETPMEDFTYNAAIYNIDDIPTKNIDLVASEDGTAELGDLIADIQDNERYYPVISTNGDFLHLIYVTNVKNSRKTVVTLVENTFATPPAEAEGYTYLEFYHKNEEGKHEGQNYLFYEIAYRLRDLNPAETKKKGICIKFINLENEVDYVYVDYKTATDK